MLIYVLTLLIPSCFYLLNINLEFKVKNILTYLYIIYLIIFIGLRHHTGGDWGGHIIAYYTSEHTFELLKFDFRGDYIYDLLNFVVLNFFGNFYVVNFTLAAFLVLSVYIYSRLLPQRFIVLLISFPYLFVVVGMGYVRQGLAISFIFISLYFLKQNKNLFYYITTLLAILSHKSSILILVISLLIGKIKLFYKLLLFFIVSLFVFIFLSNDLLRLYYYYFGEGVHLESKGAVFRNVFNSIPVIIFFLLYNKYKSSTNKKEMSIYLFFSVLQIVLIIISFFISTFADRMTIYTMPLQLFIYSYLGTFVNPKHKFLINSFILLMYNVYFFIWIQYGQFSFVWNDYQNILIEYFFNFPVIEGSRVYN